MENEFDDSMQTSNYKSYLWVTLIIIGFFIILGGALAFIFFSGNNKIFSSTNDKVEVICEIDPTTTLTNQITCSLDFMVIENFEEYQQIQKDVWEAYQTKDEKKLLESQEKLENIKISKASCIIPKGSASYELGTHSCELDPKVLSPKPTVVVTSERVQVNSPIINNYAFSGVECQGVNTLYDGQKYIVYCSRECFNIEIEPLSCAYSNGLLKLNLKRSDVSKDLVALSININITPVGEERTIGIYGIEVKDYPDNLETKTIEIPLSSDLVRSASVESVDKVTVKLNVKKRFMDRYYPYKEQIILCGGTGKTITCK